MTEIQQLKHIPWFSGIEGILDESALLFAYTIKCSSTVSPNKVYQVRVVHIVDKIEKNSGVFK